MTPKHNPHVGLGVDLDALEAKAEAATKMSHRYKVGREMLAAANDLNKTAAVMVEALKHGIEVGPVLMHVGDQLFSLRFATDEERAEMVYTPLPSPVEGPTE